MDKSDNILNNLTTVNGREEPKPKKVAKKTAKKKTVKKTVELKPLTGKSFELLNSYNIEQLTRLCEKFKAASSGNKQEMINTLLGK
tara:strand:+ start:1552 stop:1809 length:258 start_codon:yes stop_codon:yes gene_type:complete